jgi:hypothetical protein
LKVLACSTISFQLLLSCVRVKTKKLNSVAFSP